MSRSYRLDVEVLKKVAREKATVTVVAAYQLMAAKASVNRQAGEKSAAEQASSTSTTAALTPPGSLPATL